MTAKTFPHVETCASTGREKHTVVVDMDGTLLRSLNSFPYFALMAFDIGGPLRLLFLLLASPLAGILYYFVSESAGVQVLIFSTFVGAKVSSIESAARAVLVKFYSEDLHPESWRVFSSCGRKCVITANPTIMVEPFLKDFLGVDIVLGAEIETYKGRATGFVKKPGVLVGNKKADALVKAFGEEKPEIGLGDRHSDFPFMDLCKEAYIMRSSSTTEPVTRDRLPKPVIFHDGRLVQKPSPIHALVILIWLPVGFLLSLIRLATAILVPVPFLFSVWRALGVKITVKGYLPSQDYPSRILFVCSHRTVMDVLILSAVLGRQIATVSYSVSRFVELMAPVKSVRLNRNRAMDAFMIKKLLQEGDLLICPEGTTCREPFLLRFSALFAELTDHLVPVAMMNHMSMFHGTTARGYKLMDPLYFFMNPIPTYEVTFLRKVPLELTCSSGMSSYDVANYIQSAIASTLSYTCTKLTRKDKYMSLAGNDGTLENMKNSKNMTF